MTEEREPSLMSRLGISMENLKVTSIVSAGILLTNIFDRESFVVHSDESIAKQAVLALPSALPAPEVYNGSNLTTDTVVELGTTAASLLAVQSKNNTSTKEVISIAIAAQLGASALNSIVERSGWLTIEEKRQEDVGFSAISIAWFTKFLLDRAEQSKRNAEYWYTAVGGLAVTFIGLLPIIENGQGGKLDATSHAAGMITGYLGYKFFNRNKSVER